MVIFSIIKNKKYLFFLIVISLLFLFCIIHSSIINFILRKDNNSLNKEILYYKSFFSKLEPDKINNNTDDNLNMSNRIEKIILEIDTLKKKINENDIIIENLIKEEINKRK